MSTYRGESSIYEYIAAMGTAGGLYAYNRGIKTIGIGGKLLKFWIFKFNYVLTHCFLSINGTFSAFGSCFGPICWWVYTITQ